MDNRDGRHSSERRRAPTIVHAGVFRHAPEWIEPIKMSDNVWYHVAAQADDEEAVLLWMVARDDSGYTCRVWPVEGFERRKLEAWRRMADQRRAKGLAVDPPPGIYEMTPEEAHFAKIHEARAYFGVPWNPLLRRHAAEFFRQIDPVKYPG